MAADGPTTETLSITSGYSVPWARNSKAPSSAARSSKTSMNAAPMILRFCSGSVTPASRVRNSSDASTKSNGRLRRSNRVRIWVASFSRSRPLSTKMQVRRSPSALWSRSAATVESTPPDRPHTTRPGPTLHANRFHALVHERRHRPVAAAPADAEGEVPEDLLAALGVDDLRVEEQAVHPAFAVLNGRNRRVRRGRHDLESLGRRHDEIPVTGPDLQRARDVFEQRHAIDDVDDGVAELPLRRALDRSAERVGHQHHAVADPERGHAEREDGRVRSRRAGLEHAHRPARQDDARGPAPRDLGRGGRRRQNLRIHGEFTQAARDELGVLRTEIEDDDCLMRHGWSENLAIIGRARHRSRELFGRRDRRRPRPRLQRAHGCAADQGRARRAGLRARLGRGDRRPRQGVHGRQPVAGPCRGHRDRRGRVRERPTISSPGCFSHPRRWRPSSRATRSSSPQADACTRWTRRPAAQDGCGTWAAPPPPLPQTAPASLAPRAVFCARGRRRACRRGSMTSKPRSRQDSSPWMAVWLTSGWPTARSPPSTSPRATSDGRNGSIPCPRMFAAGGGLLYFGGADQALHAYKRGGGTAWRFRGSIRSARPPWTTVSSTSPSGTTRRRRSTAATAS